jgi:hypothetical protein
LGLRGRWPSERESYGKGIRRHRWPSGGAASPTVWPASVRERELPYGWPNPVVKDVGRRLGVGATPPAQSAQAPVGLPGADAQKAEALVRLVEPMGLTVEPLGVQVEGERVTLTGTTHDQETREKLAAAPRSQRDVPGADAAHPPITQTAAAQASLQAKRVARLAGDRTGVRRRYPGRRGSLALSLALC